MKVAVLQQFVRNLAAPLGAMGAAPKIQTDLDKTSLALEPFKDYDFEQFAALLAQAAAEYQRTGEWPETGGKTRAPKASKAPKMPPPSALEVAQQIKQLEEKAISSDLSRDALDEEFTKLGIEKLTVPVLKEAAKQVGAEFDSKSKKPDLIRALRRVVLEHKDFPETLHPQEVAATVGPTDAFSSLGSPVVEP